MSVTSVIDRSLTGLRALTDRVERGFAEFARVPYYNSRSRQQWEELWETEAEPCLIPLRGDGPKSASRSLFYRHAQGDLCVRASIEQP
jgi:hypothetical protein